MVSHFKELIKKYLGKITKAYYIKVNGSKEEPKYFHDKYLKEEYSVDMTYDSISGNYTRVTADVVAFDSPLPLKSRGTIKKASGDIPKIGMKYVLNEKQMNTLRILQSVPGKSKELIKKIFSDVEGCVFGIKERIEQAFLIGFSSGTTLIQDSENVGHGIRIDYDIPKSNQFGTSVKWSKPDAKPIDDIKRILKSARDKGEYPTHIWMNSDTIDLLSNNKQFKEQHAFFLNFTGTQIPVLDEDQTINVLSKKLKLKVIVIDRSFVHEKDGKKIVTQGWAPNMVVLTTGTDLGTLVYSTLAEESFPVEGVQYAKPNSYILIGKSGQTDPPSEKTTGQAIVFPVLQNVESFFYLNTEEAIEVSSKEVEGDTQINIWGGVYDKQKVINILNVLDIQTDNNITDSDLISKINELSNEEEELVKEEVLKLNNI
ncbi:conserved protein of unknown function [Tenacibaculum sp. 190524A02b]|uniref:major capsid protein n=1 Tax=Tenacibaculum vairaonense TaxID=3137860 RepID=UPI0032B1DE69